jgi:hypothetical protein
MAFTFKLEQTDGTPGDPPTIVLGVHTWHPGDTITLSAARSLRVVNVRYQGDDEPVVLVVEDSPAIKRSKRGMRRRTIVYVAVAIVVVILVVSELMTGCGPVPG